MSKFNFSDQGQGEPVILLHGNCESKEIWESFSRYLGNQYRIICPDLPGFGNTPKLDPGFSLVDVADRIKEFLDDLKIKRCTMIGHSLGGYITLAYAEKYPDTLRGFGLFHSSAYADSIERKSNRTKLIEFIRDNGVAPFIKTFVPSLFYEENLERCSESIGAVKKMANDTSGETVIEYARAMRDRPERIRVLREFLKPVLFIIGEKDGAVPFDLSLEQSRVPEKADVHILEMTGHMGMYEKPEESQKALKDFLDICYK